MLNSNKHNTKESGNIFAMLFGAVAIVGALGFTTMQMISGPITTMTKVNQKNMVDNTLMMSTKIAIMEASAQDNNGDCDSDGFVEPREWRGSPISGLNAGTIPNELGAAKQDPWGSDYGYCVWDHGVQGNSLCDSDGDAVDDRLIGPLNDSTQPVMAIISAGPDRVFQSVCSDYIDANSILLAKGGDDIIQTYTFDQASAIAPSLWKTKAGDSTTATIDKNLELSGSIQLGDVGEICLTVDQAGTMRYNLTDRNVEVCSYDDETSSWDFMQVSSGGGGAANAFEVDNSDIDCDEDFLPAGAVDGISDHIGKVRYNNNDTTSNYPTDYEDDFVEYCDGIDWRKMVASKTAATLNIQPETQSNMNVTGSGNPSYSAEYTFVVKNIGALDSMTPTPVLSNTTDFDISSNTCTTILTPGDTCVVGIKAKANVSKSYTGYLTISANNNPQAALIGEANMDCPIAVAQSGGLVAACNSDHYLITTPAGCNDSATPTCGNLGDTLKKKWSTVSAITSAVSSTDGAGNTALLASLGADYQAASYCENLVYGGKNDWYLPVRTEIDQVLSAKAGGIIINTISDNDRYWVSTEDNSSNAHTTNGSATKTNDYWTRCVRKDTSTALAGSDPCTIGDAGMGGIYASCSIASAQGSYNLISMPGGCNGVNSNPTCDGSTDSNAVRRQWGEPYINFTGLDDNNIGVQNTVNAMQLTAVQSHIFNAIQYCSDMTYNGYSDWYLPAPSELSGKIWPNRVAIGGFNTSGSWDFYWTSRQASGNDYRYAYALRTSTGTISSSGNDIERWDNRFVRCVRRDNLPLPEITIDNTPNTLDFNSIAVTYTSGGSVSSAVGTITGINGAISVSVSGDGNPSIKINGSNVGSSGSVNYNDTIQLVANAPSVLGQTNDITVTIGGSTYNWKAGYANAGATATIFITSTTTRDSLGGIGGADTICNSRATTAGLGGTWTALISDDNVSAASRIPWNVGTYRRIDNAIIANSIDDLFDGSINSPVTIDENNNPKTECVFTGTNGDGTSHAENKNNWTSGYSVTGRKGNSGTTNSQWLSYSSSSNSGTYCSLYCLSENGASVDDQPDDINFAMKGGAADTRFESDSVIISGATPNSAMNITLTGSQGNPTFKVNGGAEQTTGTILNGDSLAIVIDTPSIDGIKNSVTVQVGTGNIAIYRALTIPSTTTIKRAFITSKTYQGNGFGGGTGGAASTCQSLADDAGIGGTWQSIISGTGNIAEDVASHVDLSWTELRRIDGALITDSPLKLFQTDTIPLYNPINIDENGATVTTTTTAWTNTLANGNKRFAKADYSENISCWNWTSTSGGSTNYSYGSISSTSSSWMDLATTSDCSTSRRLYCMEKVASVPVNVTTPRSCKEALAMNKIPDGGGSVGDNGVYTIDPDDDLLDYPPIQAYCDMTTTGGPWTLVANYVHKGGTNPATVPMPFDLPKLNSSVLGVDEAASVYWGHATPPLITQFHSTNNYSKVRFECWTSNHARIMSFYTTSNDCLTYLRTGTNYGVSCRGSTLGAVSLPLHSSNLPNVAANATNNGGANALIHSPFFSASNGYDWTVGNSGGDWECDDDPDDASKNTIHRVWIN